MDKFERDCKRYSVSAKGIRRMLSIFRNPMLRALYYNRCAENMKSSAMKVLLCRKAEKLYHKNGIEIGNTNNIGSGFCIVHPYQVTINSRAKIGEDFTIFKGATIGSIRSGVKKGTPHIGNRVTICTGAFVCGNITIGDDVLIAANAFCNFDVPSDSVVIGNPGVIHHKDSPSADYLQ